MASKSILRPLSKSVYYLPAPSSIPTPTLSSSSKPVKDPSLLIVFGWMDAQLRHIEKYLTSYRSLFPSSPILLLQSSQSGFYSTKKALESRKEFGPAIEMIRKQQHLQGKGKGKGGVLVHVFSNGGCMSLKWLNQELEKSSAGEVKETDTTEKTRLLSQESTTNPSLTASSPSTPLPLPAQAIIFDSCPGRSSLLVTMRAFSAPIRSKLLKLPTMGLLAILHSLITLYNLVLRKPPILNRLYSYLNESTTLPPVPRLYLYSTKDELIPYKDVEEHGLEAREKGVEVRMERFEKSSHVGHARVEGERYWNAIEEVWGRSQEGK